MFRLVPIFSLKDLDLDFKPAWVPAGIVRAIHGTGDLLPFYQFAIEATGLAVGQQSLDHLEGIKIGVAAANTIKSHDHTRHIELGGKLLANRSLTLGGRHGSALRQLGPGKG